MLESRGAPRAPVGESNTATGTRDAKDVLNHIFIESSARRLCMVTGPGCMPTRRFLETLINIGSQDRSTTIETQLKNKRFPRNSGRHNAVEEENAQRRAGGKTRAPDDFGCEYQDADRQTHQRIMVHLPGFFFSAGLEFCRMLEYCFRFCMFGAVSGGSTSVLARPGFFCSR